MNERINPREQGGLNKNLYRTSLVRKMNKKLTEKERKKINT